MQAQVSQLGRAKWRAPLFAGKRSYPREQEGVKGNWRHTRLERSPDAEAYRKLYNSSRWRKLRWDVLVRDLFTCQRCKRMTASTSKLVADHIKEHKGDPDLFWSEVNIQCLCKLCHDGAKQSEERGGRPRPMPLSFGSDGWPVGD